MKRHVFRVLLAFLFSPLSVFATLVYVDLSSVPGFQNQFTPAPSPPNTGVSVSSLVVSIPNIAVGGGTFSLDFTINDSLGSSGLIERAVRLESRLNDVELVFTSGPPEPATALTAGTLLDASANWYTTGEKHVLLTRHVVVLGSDVEQGEWIDGQEHFVGFRFEDNGAYYYGFLGATITTWDTTPTLSLSGYAYENLANQAVTIGAIPETATTATLISLGCLVAVAVIRRRRRDGAPLPGGHRPLLGAR